jgi:hypothetical protein
VISELEGFPADHDKVEGFLNDLKELKKGLPVGTTAGAVKRFRVAEDDFERRIVLYSGNENNATLYVGTSPSFRKVHARIPGEDRVYAVEFDAYEAGVKPEDWIDKDVLSHKPSDIIRVELPNLTLIRKEETLFVEDIDGETEETIEDAARRLLDHVAGLRIRSVLGTEAEAEYNQDDPAFQYKLDLVSGDSESYVFSRPKDADYYVLKPSHRDEYFKVDTWVLDRIKETERQTLVLKNDKGDVVNEETGDGKK